MFAQKFQEDSENKYELRKKQKYGESWKSMDIFRLRQRLFQEIEEWKNIVFEIEPYTPDKEYEELMDIRNFCSMIGERIRKPQSSNKENIIIVNPQ